MVTKKDLVIAVLGTFCLTVTLFTIMPTKSSPSTMEYDPRLDVTGPIEGVPDGVINMRDIGYVCNLFGATGTPINWTQLMENVTKLQAVVEALETRIPKKGYVSISPTAFTPKDEIESYSKSISYMCGGGLFYATLQLPNGVTITNMSICAKDDIDGDSVYIVVSLWRDNILPGFERMAEVITHGSPGTVILYDDTIDYATIDYQHNTYCLQLYFSGEFLGDLEFYWALIEYEYPQ